MASAGVLFQRGSLRRRLQSQTVHGNFFNSAMGGHVELGSAEAKVLRPGLVLGLSERQSLWLKLERSFKRVAQGRGGQ